MLTFTAADGGSRQTVEVGARFAVELAENPTTGYRWHAEAADPGLLTVGDEFTAGGAARGAPGTRRLVFEPRAAGTFELRLRQYRSWEPDDVIGEFAITVTTA